jgi:hypothetical protein
MENPGSDPDIAAIITETQKLLADGAMTVEAAISGLIKIVAGLREKFNLSDARLRPISDLIEKLERDNPIIKS